MSEKYHIKKLCPTCYEFRDSEISKELYEAMSLEESRSIVNQCDKCRESGREVNLNEFEQTLSFLKGADSVGQLISEESIREGLLWLKKESPKLYEELQKGFLESEEIK